MDDFSPTLTPPNSFICNKKNYKHQADMDISLVENMVKKNHNHFPIVVLLTTLICIH